MTADDGHRGTIFLDESARCLAGLQAKLLRVLEDGVVRPVGADRRRGVGLARDRRKQLNLTDSVARGAFREDLFYRLQVVPIVIAPAARASFRHPTSGRSLSRAYPRSHARTRNRNQREAMVALWSYDWRKFANSEQGERLGDPVRGLDIRHRDAAGEPGGSGARDTAYQGQAE